MIHTEMESLQKLFDLCEENRQKILLHRAENFDNFTDVFKLEIRDSDGAILIEITTRNIESAALYALNHYDRRTQ